MYLIDTKSSVPVFKQIEKQTIEFISIHILNPDDQLPSVRQVAIDLGINPNTVAKAYKELEEQGYVYSKKGKGCFVSVENTSDSIKKDVLKNFEVHIEDIKRHGVSKEDLIEVIERMYRQ